jgi:hypothetical protein
MLGPAGRWGKMNHERVVEPLLPLNHQVASII